MLSVKNKYIMLSVVLLSVVMLNDVALEKIIHKKIITSCKRYEVNVLKLFDKTILFHHYSIDSIHKKVLKFKVGKSMKQNKTNTPAYYTRQLIKSTKSCVVKAT
jgi:hypothetical protein